MARENHGGFSQIGNYLLVLLYYDSYNSNYSNTMRCLTLTTAGLIHDLIHPTPVNELIIIMMPNYAAGFALV